MAPGKTMEESDASMRKRLVESLSASFPGSALSKALHAMDGDSESEKSDDPLSSSCFAELRLEQGPLVDEDDDELTSLSWLQDTNLIKSIGGDERLCASPTGGDELSKENDDNEASYANSHPPNVPYNPQKHVTSKPPYSFSCLIFMAIEDSPIKKLPVKDIYNWILTHFPYFQNAPTGWKNSVRHNLSLNKCFKKVEKEKGQTIGKGSLWCIDPYYRPNLLQALRKTPYHPYCQLQMLATPTPNAGYTILSGTPRPLNALSNRLNLNTPSPHLFPFLSKRLAQSKIDCDSDIDVANTLVSLKRAAEHGRGRPHKNGLYGRRSRSPSPPEFGSERERELLKAKYRNMYQRDSPPVIHQWPSDDHAYSLTRLPHFAFSAGSDVDEEYDWGSDDEVDDDFSDTSEGSRYSDCDSAGEGRVSPGKRKRKSYRGKTSSPAYKRRAMEEDEATKLVEGADALLNLAGIKTRGTFRKTSPNNNNNEKHDQYRNEGRFVITKLS